MDGWGWVQGVGESQGDWLGAKDEGWRTGAGFLEGLQRLGFVGKRVLAKNHAEGSR